MRSHHRILALVALLALLATLPADAAPQVTPATPDVRVQVGAAPPGGPGHPFAYTRFYPERVQVHRGQSVLFDTVPQIDLHTVAIWPGGEAARPPAFRRNESPEPVAVNEPVWKRSVCGGEAQPACVLGDPDAALSSGLSAITERTWRVTVDVPVGTTIPYICMVHPGMTGQIEVVHDAIPLPSQPDLDAQARQQIQEDTDEAIAHRAELDERGASRQDGDRTIWEVLVGAATPSGHVSLMAYLPSVLWDAKPGDAVEFVSAGMGHHSVTFPAALVGGKEPGPEARLAFSAIHPACDPDQLDHGAYGVPGAWAPFSPAECPFTFELVVSPWLSAQTPAPNHAVSTPATYHDSGLMWSEKAPDIVRTTPYGSHFPHRFLAEFPTAGTFAYSCTVHGTAAMSGSVRVGS